MTRPCSSAFAAFLAAVAAVALGCADRPLGDARADATGGGFPPGMGTKLDASFVPTTDAPAPAPTTDGAFPGNTPPTPPPPGPAPRADGGFGPPTPPPPGPSPGPAPRTDGGFGGPPVPPRCAATTCAAGTICCDYQCGATCVQGTSCPPAPGVVLPCGLCNADTDCNLANLLCTPGGSCECRPTSRFDVVAPFCAACSQPGTNACAGKSAACVLGKCVVR